MHSTTPKRARGARRKSKGTALVLRRFPFRESSLVCHVLAREQGRVSVLAKGAYRPRSAYSGVLDLFDTLELTWSPGADLANLRSGRILVRRAHICRDLDRYRAGTRVLELATLAARDGHEERELFDLVSGALDALQGGAATPELVSTVFDLRFLAGLGLEPALLHCAHCGSSLATDTRPRTGFSTPLGGRLCDPCARGVAGDRGAGLETVPTGLLRIARSLLDTPWPDLERIRLESERTRKLRAIVRRFLEYHLGTRPRASGPLPRPKASTKTPR